MSYELAWITNHLAAGHAPMSYEELESIKEQGIDAIVNLCGEFSDLHELEEKAGFEVCYLPTPDEHAPDMVAMEQALEWLDEAIYLNKNVLVHCRHGQGRTGTFVSAYLLRRGFGLKKTEQMLKRTKASPTNFSQWKLLRKFNKKQGLWTLTEPQAELKAETADSDSDLAPFLLEYEAISTELDRELTQQDDCICCGQDSNHCCQEYFELQLAESFWIQTTMNRLLNQDDRQQVIERALFCSGVVKTVTSLHRNYPKLIDEDFADIYLATATSCPLSVDGKCILFARRPFRCRWRSYKNNENSDKTTQQPEQNMRENKVITEDSRAKYNNMLANISRNMYLALTGDFPPEDENLCFSMVDTVSGKFVQSCFTIMQRSKSKKEE